MKVERLIRKYGEEILQDFINIATDPHLKLVHLAKKYGFTRERARQLFVEVNGIPYTEYRKKKMDKYYGELEAHRIDTDKRAERSVGNNSVHKGTKTEQILYKECRSRGLNIMPLYDKVDFKINGKKVEFKSAFRSHSTRDVWRKYYHFTGITDNESKNLQFFIALVVPENVFYIIPKDVIGEARQVCVADNRNPPPMRAATNSKYSVYKNAWHLLQ